MGKALDDAFDLGYTLGRRAGLVQMGEDLTGVEPVDIGLRLDAILEEAMKPDERPRPDSEIIAPLPPRPKRPVIDGP